MQKVIGSCKYKCNFKLLRNRRFGCNLGCKKASYLEIYLFRTLIDILNFLLWCYFIHTSSFLLMIVATVDVILTTTPIENITSQFKLRNLLRQFWLKEKYASGLMLAKYFLKLVQLEWFLKCRKNVIIHKLKTFSKLRETNTLQYINLNLNNLITFKRIRI